MFTRSTPTTCRRLVPWLGALALLAAVTVFTSSAWAGGGPVPIDPPDKPGIGEGSDAPGKFAQWCFDKHLENQARCKFLWCEHQTLFGIFSWTSCDETNLDMCLQDAEWVFKCCVKPENC